jgi:hypothetical protein
MYWSPEVYSHRDLDAIAQHIAAACGGLKTALLQKDAPKTTAAVETALDVMRAISP